jgi:uncharacterized membrane protein YqaE (UPF0057 family)
MVFVFVLGVHIWWFRFRLCLAFAQSQWDRKLSRFIVSFADVVLVPPLGVFLISGCGVDFFINILLTILGYVLHSLFYFLWDLRILLATSFHAYIPLHARNTPNTTPKKANTGQVPSRPHPRLLPRVCLLQSPQWGNRSCSRCILGTDSAWRAA